MKFLSGLITSGSGSYGGMTVSHNKGGMYMRARAIPTNPNTVQQVSARTALANAASLWRTLSEAQRTSWASYAQNTPTVNALGQTTHLSGFQWFVAVASFCSYAGLTQPDYDAPATPGTAAVPTENIYDLVRSSGDITPQYTGGDSSANSNYVRWISNPLSVGVGFYKGPWTLLDPIQTTGADREDVLVATQPVTAPSVFYIRMRYIILTENRLSPVIIVPVNSYS